MVSTRMRERTRPILASCGVERRKERMSPELLKRIDDFIRRTETPRSSIKPHLDGIFELSGGDERMVLISLKFSEPLFPKYNVQAGQILIHLGKIIEVATFGGDKPEGKEYVGLFMGAAEGISDYNDRAQFFRGMANALEKMSVDYPEPERLMKLLGRFSTVASTLMEMGKGRDAVMLVGSILPRFSSTLRNPMAAFKLLDIYREELRKQASRRLMRKRQDG
ncbi:MAG: hypothetical protein KGH94_00850 [Candidatus Micrarchaeota archaeon]|nr:hypothetical protein [Candidatus Micrarchaeota archaeon]